MKKVLIISPHFPPINAPDHQRIRMALPYFKNFGWDPTVIAVEPQFVEGKKDGYLLKTIPQDVRIIYVKALKPNITRKIGVGNLAIRSYFQIQNVVDALLKKEKFDLIFFSTAMFLTMILGLRWYRKFNVPYVLDFQDPWVSNYYVENKAEKRPGGNLKYNLSQLLARIFEPKVVRRAAHIVSVSEKYPAQWRSRYHWLKEDNTSFLPFGASIRDFQLLENFGVNQNFFNKDDDLKHFVYVGRGGQDIDELVLRLFNLVRRIKDTDVELYNHIRLYFIGTSYDTNQGLKTIYPVAVECGVDDVVCEIPERVGYFEALKLMKDSDGVFLLGSKDKAYSPSKIYPAFYANRPICAVAFKESQFSNI
jgi:hypothetical protein